MCRYLRYVFHYNSIRQRTKLTGMAILIPGSSPWKYIWDNADDASFLELTGFNRHSFNLLLLVLFPDPIAQVFGHPRLFDYKDEFDLYLKSEITGKIWDLIRDELFYNGIMGAYQKSV